MNKKKTLVPISAVFKLFYLNLSKSDKFISIDPYEYCTVKYFNTYLIFQNALKYNFIN